MLQTKDHQQWACFYPPVLFACTKKNTSGNAKNIVKTLFLVGWAEIKWKCNGNTLKNTWRRTWSMWLNRPLKRLKCQICVERWGAMRRLTFHISITFSTLFLFVWGLAGVLITPSYCVLFFCNSLTALDCRIGATNCLSQWMLRETVVDGNTHSFVFSFADF